MALALAPHGSVAVTLDDSAGTVVESAGAGVSLDVRRGEWFSTTGSAVRHFEGVTTIVAKLFAVSGPCTAVFGRKDYQQLRVIERMVQESKQNEAADKKRREVIQIKNDADNLTYQIEKALRDLGDKVPSAEKASIETKVNELKQAAQGDDIERIKKLTEELQNTFHVLSQQMYAQGQGQQPQGRAKSPGR